MQRPDPTRQTIVLDPPVHDRFAAMLDEPARDMPRLRRTLAAPTPFDKPAPTSR